MARSLFLAAAIIVLGLLSATSAQAQSTGNATLLLLGKTVPTATVTGAVIDVVATKTVYYVYCSAGLPDLIHDPTGPFPDPCPLIGGSVTHEATRWEYDVDKVTEDVRGTGLGTFTAETTRSTTGKIVCDVTSNEASCTGSLTSYHTTRGQTRSGSTVISTRISDVGASLETVAITSGMVKLQTSTTTATTSSSTGAAGPIVATQPAKLLVGAAVMVGGAFIV